MRITVLLDLLKKVGKSLRWTSELESIRREVNKLTSAGLTTFRVLGNSVEGLSRDMERGYLYPNRGHSSILMRLQQSDPTFNMGVDVTRPAYNFEPQYRVTMSMREDWAKATDGAPTVIC